LDAPASAKIMARDALCSDSDVTIHNSMLSLPGTLHSTTVQHPACTNTVEYKSDTIG
jgi:hypothetical protein